ncbi:MAG: fructokinase, partial [Gammaproteobacteria bacterium]
GGAPGNVAVGLQQLGIDSGFIGKVGNDPFGHFLVDNLKAKGVDTSAIVYSEEARTGLAFVSLKADGDREFLFYRHPSADMLLRSEELNESVIRSAQLLHFGSITLIDDPVRSATLRAIDIAGDSNCRISYDPNLRLALWPDAASAKTGMLLGLSKANIVKISEEEVEFLTGTTDPGTARELLWHENLDIMIVTHGSKGCSYLTREFQGYINGFSINAVDSTGAGDGFVAGLLQALLTNPETIKNQPLLRQACRFANAVGAITTTGRGAIPSLPDIETVQHFLDANP